MGFSLGLIVVNGDLGVDSGNYYDVMEFNGSCNDKLWAKQCYSHLFAMVDNGDSLFIVNNGS